VLALKPVRIQYIHKQTKQNLHRFTSTQKDHTLSGCLGKLANLINNLERSVSFSPMPHSRVRLSAGRNDMSDEMQAMCFFAGANSIFYGDKLLTTDNPMTNSDLALFERLGVRSAGSSYA
jgi:hypothetical protein